MQTPHRFLTTPHRRQRLALWAIAMLTWIASVLFAGKHITYRQVSQRYKRVSIERLTRLTIHLMIVRAAELASQRPRKRLRLWKHGRDLRRPHLRRSLIGSKLRRVLKRKDAAVRITRLIGVLRNLHFYSLQLAARMKRRLTRLWAIRPARTPAELLLAAALVRRSPKGVGESLPAIADSS